jgi:hypothetical protein
LISRLGTDFLSAASAASMVAPIIAIIDRSVYPLSTLSCPLHYHHHSNAMPTSPTSKLQTPNSKKKLTS